MRIFIVLFLWSTITLAQGGYINKSTVINADTRITLIAPYDSYNSNVMDNDNALIHLIDKNPNTYWAYTFSRHNQFAYEMDEKYLTLVVNFESPIYLRGVKITNGCAKYYSASYVYMERRYTNTPNIPIGDFIILDHATNSTWLNLKDLSRNQWSKIFTTKRLVFHVIKLKEDVENGIGCISDIDFQYDTQSHYKPQYGWESLSKQIHLNKHDYVNAKGKKVWTANNIINSNTTVLGDIVYYATQGIAEARELLHSFQTGDVDINTTVQDFLIPALEMELRQKEGK